MTNIAAAITEVKALLGQRLNTSKSVCELHGKMKPIFLKCYQMQSHFHIIL